MKNHIKKKMVLAAMLMLPLSTFAQNTFVNNAKEIINDYMLVIVGFGIIIAAAVGVLYNLDDLADKEGKGTKQKALTSIAWIVGIAFISILAIIAIINFVASQSIRIN